MNISARCPCCSNKLVHYINRNRDYWFCKTCWSEMPIINDKEIQKNESSYHHEVEKEPIDSHDQILNFS